VPHKQKGRNFLSIIFSDKFIVTTLILSTTFSTKFVIVQLTIMETSHQSIFSTTFSLIIFFLITKFSAQLFIRKENIAHKHPCINLSNVRNLDRYNFFAIHLAHLLEVGNTLIQKNLKTFKMNYLHVIQL